MKSYKIPLLLSLCLFVFHLAFKDFTNPYERPISGDAQAYYAYLPAIFIYQDMSYEFVDEINAKYYPKSHQKSFLKPVEDRKVNKTFPGVALLYLPFFLIAHALAGLLGFDADGYSTIYQVCFDCGLWVYLSLSLILLFKVLKRLRFSAKVSNWTLALILLTTNILFYSVYDQSVTHIYNFFLINAFILVLLKFKETFQLRDLLWAIFLIALIGIIRPTNVLVLGLVLFFIPDVNFYQSVGRFVLKIRHIIPIGLVATAVFSIPFVLWKLQTGHWVVYSYGDEGFNFSNPHYFDFLFSYLKGWFVYSPFILLILLIGFGLLYKVHKRRFIIGITFYLLSIYIFSSWWCWYYGAGMGQRVMIDHYILLAFLLALILKNVLEGDSNIKRVALGVVTAFFIFLNFAQAYQIKAGILTGGSATKAQYWDNFLVFEKRAQVYPHDHWVLEESFQFPLGDEDPNLIKGESYWVEENQVVQVTADKAYSASLQINARALRPGSKLILGFEARARNPISLTRIVMDLGGEQKVFGLDQYLKKDEWVKVEFLVEPQQIINESVIFYFWNGGSEEKVEFRNIEANNYYSAEYL